MPGIVEIIPWQLDRKHRIFICQRSPSLRRVHCIVGGFVEAIPHWNRFAGQFAGLAICNEEGKMEGLPLNPRATTRWYVHMNRTVDDILVGNVVLIYGDREFLGDWGSDY